MKRVASFEVFVTPAHWQFWPVWTASMYSDVRRINLGPLVIRWYLVPK